MNQLTGHLDSQTIFRNSAGGQIDLGYDEPLRVFLLELNWFNMV